MVVFTKHAKEKFAVLERHGFVVFEEQVRRAVEFPEQIDMSRAPLRIGQIQIDETHVLRVVYKQEGEIRKVITFYPGRNKQYGQR